MTRRSRYIDDLEHTVNELRGFKDHLIDERDKLRAIQRAIFDLHAPVAVMPPGGTRIEVQCRVCEPGPSGSRLWPCPTAAMVTTYAVYAPIEKPEGDR